MQNGFRKLDGKIITGQSRFIILRAFLYNIPMFFNHTVQWRMFYRLEREERTLRDRSTVLTTLSYCFDSADFTSKNSVFPKNINMWSSPIWWVVSAFRSFVPHMCVCVLNANLPVLDSLILSFLPSLSTSQLKTSRHCESSPIWQLPSLLCITLQQF